MKKILTAPALAVTAGSASGGVYRVGLPRTDLEATLDGGDLGAAASVMSPRGICLIIPAALPSAIGGRALRKEASTR